MRGIALEIVIASAFLHSGWNYLLKKSRRKIAFIWWFLLFSLVFYFPVFLYFWPQTVISKAGWICVAATGFLHGLYFWVMGEAYERGELSLVYPIARGSGPLFVPVLAVLLLHEKLCFSGVIGIALVVLGIYVIHLRSFVWRSLSEPFMALRGGASLWALYTGGTIAAYSLVDKIGVGIVYPPVYQYLMLAITWFLLLPYVLTRERIYLMDEWRVNKGTILIAGILVVLAYLMVLFAFRISEVSYVVAVREVSIVISTFYGIALLGEKHGKQKLAGAALIVSGVVLIGLSGQ